MLIFFANFSAVRSAEEPVKPLSSSRPLVAVIMGIESYSIKTHSFYYTEPQVKITLDQNFLQDFTNYGDMKITDVPKVVRETTETVKALCKLCKLITDNYELVQDRRGQCIPPVEEFDTNGYENGERYMEIFNSTFRQFEECQGLPETKIVSGELAMGTVGKFQVPIHNSQNTKMMLKCQQKLLEFCRIALYITSTLYITKEYLEAFLENKKVDFLYYIDKLSSF